MFAGWVLEGESDGIGSVVMSDSVASASTDYPGEKEVRFEATYQDKPALPDGSTQVIIHIVGDNPSGNNLVQVGGPPADFEVEGQVGRTETYSTTVLNNKLTPGSDYTMNFYSSEITLNFQYSASAKFDNDGNIHEIWYKCNGGWGGSVTDYDPG